MAGPMTRAVYHGDDGTSYSVRMPTWEFALNPAAAAATTEPALPKGYQRRKRYYRITASGVEGSVTVLSPTSILWTDGFGTARTVPDFGGLAAVDATLEGRTGERSKHI